MSLQPFFVSSVTSFQTHFPEDVDCKVGWLEKTGRIWRATQNIVEFFECDTGHSLYTWEYTPSKYAIIQNVCECETSVRKIYYLLTIRLTSSSVVCLLEFNRLIKAIELPVKIASQCYFNYSTGLTYSTALSSFNGIVVLGCYGGHVLTMDLQLDVAMENSIDDEFTHASLQEINPSDSPKVTRQQLLKEGIHVCFDLNSKLLCDINLLFCTSWMII